jgi:hypothetical protein
MASIEDELQAAQAAKAALDKLSPGVLREVTITILRNANQAAMTGVSFSSQERLVDARHKLVIVLSDLIKGPPSQERSDRAKAAVQEWINQLGNLIASCEL